MVDLHLTTAEFYALTPCQFSLLIDAHKKRLAHAEMLQAMTTAAVINYAFSPPEHPVSASDFCFNLRPPKVAQVQAKYTEDDIIDWQTRVANLAAEMRKTQGK